MLRRLDATQLRDVLLVGLTLPPELVEAHLGVDDQFMSKLPRTRPFVV